MKIHLNALYGRMCCDTEKIYLKDIFQNGRIYADTDSIKRKENKTMKVVKKYAVPIEELPDFLAEHTDEEIIVKAMTDEKAHIRIMQDLAESEFYMTILQNLVADPSDRIDISTLEERNAIDYALGAIKTLIDMGVLKDD